MLKVMMWHTPKGIIDEGGMTLDGYLNFNITLLAPPANNVMSVSLHALEYDSGTLECTPWYSCGS